MKFLEAINYDKYKELIDETLFKRFLELDPTKNKDYSQWIIAKFFKKFKNDIDEYMQLGRLKQNSYDSHSGDKQFYSYPLSYHAYRAIVAYYDRRGDLHRFFDEDGDKLTKDLQKYHLLKTKNKLLPEEKNIMNIKSFADLWNLVEKYVSDIEKLDLQVLTSDDYDKWYEDSEWLVVNPKTKEAAIKYGKGTRWCTSGVEENLFHVYAPKGPLIIIIQKNVDKWQLHFATDQWKDTADEELENRTGWLKSLPLPVRKAIYDKTDEIMFSPEYFEALSKLKKNLYYVKRIIGTLGDGSVETFWELNSDSDFFSTELLNMAIQDYYIENNIDFSDAYAYGYDNPWIYIDEEPELWEKEECPVCDGKKYVLPKTLSRDTYISIASGKNEYVNGKLTTDEINQFLALYKLSEDDKYILISQDDELAQKLKQPCPSCKGKGYEPYEKDADLYSEEQRGEAGSNSESESIDESISEFTNNFRNFHILSRKLSRRGYLPILDKCLEIIKDNIESFEGDALMLLDNVLAIYSGETYTSDSSLYQNTEEAIEKSIKEIIEMDKNSKDTN